MVLIEKFAHFAYRVDKKHTEKSAFLLATAHEIRHLIDEMKAKAAAYDAA